MHSGDGAQTEKVTTYEKIGPKDIFEFTTPNSFPKPGVSFRRTGHTLHQVVHANGFWKPEPDKQAGTPAKAFDGSLPVKVISKVAPL